LAYTRILILGLLLFWALWLSIVFLTNVFDGLKKLKILPEGWRLASGNVDAVRRALGERAPGWLVGILFAGATLWEGVATALFWRALLLIGQPQAVMLAFIASLALWALFILLDELLVQYEMEGSHLRIFMAQLITLAVLLLFRR
jgi:hypothetical protein